MAKMESLTTTDILAAVSKILESGGYQQIEPARFDAWSKANVRLFEDPYNIVAVVVYDTWRDLSSNWISEQASLVELISSYVKRTEPKAWDGYLVLLTTGVASNEAEVTQIRYDTSRVRKLVATGDELRGLSDINRVLLPLLPMGEDEELGEEDSVLDMLPGLLSQRGIPEDAVSVVIEAFHNQQPLVEQLHKYRSRQ